MLILEETRFQVNGLAAVLAQQSLNSTGFNAFSFAWAGVLWTLKNT